MNLKQLIEDLIYDLSNNSSLEKIMLKAKTIAFQLENTDFLNWIEMESNGYKDIEMLPEYRKFKCSVQASIEFPYKGTITNLTIPVDAIKDKYTKKLLSEICIKESIFEIEKFVQNGDNNNLRMNAPIYAYSKVNELYPYGNIYDLWLCINATSTVSVIMHVKNKLLDFFLKLNKQMDMNIDFDVIKNKKEVTKIINQTITAGVIHTGNGNIEISDNTILDNINNQIDISQDIKQQLENIINKIEIVTKKIDNNKTEDILDAITIIKKELDTKNNNSKTLKLAFNAIKGAVAGLTDIGIEKLAEQAIKLLL
jgi:hypothetical protein